MFIQAFILSINLLVPRHGPGYRARLPQFHPKVKLLAADGQEPGDDMRQGAAIFKLPTRTNSRSLEMLGLPSEMLDSRAIIFRHLPTDGNDSSKHLSSGSAIVPKCACAWTSLSYAFDGLMEVDFRYSNRTMPFLAPPCGSTQRPKYPTILC